MRLNEKTAIATSKVLLVPYEAHHVLKYHSWMQDPAIQEATASEPLTLAEEYENQQSWRTSPDKLTFIICAAPSPPPPPSSSPSTSPLAPSSISQASRDPAQMRGDINFFLYPSDSGVAGRYTGEVDVMIADAAHRGHGLGGAAVRALLVYIRRHERALLGEFVPREAGAVLDGLMVKIKEGNEGSRALFRRLGFVQTGGVNYFGEVLMVLPRLADEGRRDGYLEELAWWDGAVADYQELESS